MSVTATNSSACSFMTTAPGSTSRPLPAHPLLDHRALPAATQRARQALALIVAAVPEAGARERYGDEPARLPPGGVEAGHGRGQVGGNTWQAAVLQRVDRVARTRFEPYGGPRHPEGRGPIGAHPAAPDRRRRL